MPYGSTCKQNTTKQTGKQMTTTKQMVRSEFTYARHLMRLAEEAMKNPTFDFENAEQIALELSAATSTFLNWVEQQAKSN